MAHNGEGQNQWKYGQEASEYGSSGTGLNAGGGYGDSSQRLVSFFGGFGLDLSRCAAFVLPVVHSVDPPAPPASLFSHALIRLTLSLL